MAKFRKGDIIIGRSEATKAYSITTKGWIGRVLRVENKRIHVVSVYAKQDCENMPDDYHYDEYTLNPDYFDLFPIFPEDAETKISHWTKSYILR